MPKKPGAPTPVRDERRKPSSETAGKEASSPTSVSLGTRFNAECFAGHPADATYKEWHGVVAWQIGCFHDHSREPEYLPNLAEFYGLDRTRFTKQELAFAMRDAGREVTSTRQVPSSNPRISQVENWVEALQRNSDALKYLESERGIHRVTATVWKLGYSSVGEGPWTSWQRAGGFVFPIFRMGSTKGGPHHQLVTVRKRFWPDVPVVSGKPVKYVSLHGHGATLYPGCPARAEHERGSRFSIHTDPPPNGGQLILCEGEFDALVAAEHEIVAVTTTCGKTLPAQLARRFKGWNVAVTYDVGADRSAARTVDKLRDVGAREAWAVPLDLPHDGDDLTDWFVKYGRSADELSALIERTREASK